MAHWRCILPADRFFEIEYGHEILIEAPAEGGCVYYGFCRREWQLTVPPVRSGRTSLWTGVIPSSNRVLVTSTSRAKV